MAELTPRDLELLRTLGRLHYAPSALFGPVFFPAATQCYRRLRRLAADGLVLRHTRSDWSDSRYCTWRLTRRGVEAVLGRWPVEESIVNEDMVARVERQSLHSIVQREAIVQIYLDLITGGCRGDLQERTGAGLRDWIAYLTARADRFRWQQVTSRGLALPSTDGKNAELIVSPSALIGGSRLAVFLHVDGASANGGNGLSTDVIREHLGCYRTLVNKKGHMFRVVYVALTKRRRAVIRRIAKAVYPDTLIMDPDQVPGWLGVPFCGDPAPSSPAVEQQPAATGQARTIAVLDRALRAANDVCTLRSIEFLRKFGGPAAPPALAAWADSLQELQGELALLAAEHTRSATS